MHASSYTCEWVMSQIQKKKKCHAMLASFITPPNIVLFITPTAYCLVHHPFRIILRDTKYYPPGIRHTHIHTHIHASCTRIQTHYPITPLQYDITPLEYYTHTYTHAYTLAYTRSVIHAYTHTYTLTHIHTYTHTHIHIYTHTHIHT